MLEDFHFIRPLWLLALVPLALLAWRLSLPGGGDNPWRRVVDANLLQFLMAGRAQAVNRTALWLAAAGWIVAALALADPTWERRPEPLYQTSAARVVVLDLSSTMNAVDLSPSRMVRARYKVEDALDQSAEGQTGLVVYAGDAFAVSPLTRDVNTIRALLKVLDPSIMPIDGNRADLGLLKARELLQQAGASSGQVLLIADGVDADRAPASERAAARLRSDGYRVSVLGIGTPTGAPVADDKGRLLRDASGRIVVSRLASATLRSLAHAGGGQYRSISDSGAALRALLAGGTPMQTKGTVRSDSKTQGWKDQGPLLAVLLLPLAALAFRRNWLLGLTLFAALALPPRPAMAGTWTDLWQRPDQQAAKALAAGDYARAAELATDASRRGSAEYKRGNYRLALENFARARGTDADYNRGNALARLGRYQEAIAAYDQALKQNPGDADATANKAAVEAMLKQQAKQEARNPRDGAVQNGGGRNSQGSGRNSSSPQAKMGGSGASSGPSQQPASAGQRGSQNGKSPGGPREGEAAGTPRPNAGNSFAEAVNRLAAKQSGGEPPTGESPRGNAEAGGEDSSRAGGTAKQGRGAVTDRAQPLDSEEQLAAEQWLRRIPDDPGGLLRRKFLYQYRQRAHHGQGEAL
jgi:Ca-activated chloride channel family protein